MQIEPRVLENDHVRLEPLQARHKAALRGPADDFDTWAISLMRGDGAHFDAWWDFVESRHRAGSQISHAVYDKIGKAYVGHTAFLSIEPVHRRLEIGWTWYAREARGSAINPACKFLLLDRAFDSGAVRVELKTHHLNAHSQNAMLKMGATREGRLRRHTLTWTGEWRDTVYFSVLDHEWPRVRDGLLRRLDGFGATSPEGS